MTDRHLYPVNPPSREEALAKALSAGDIEGVRKARTPSTDDTARGVALMHRLLARVPLEQSRADGDHIIRAIRRLGEIADAYEFGHADIDGEVEDAIVSLLRWRLDREREAAR